MLWGTLLTKKIANSMNFSHVTHKVRMPSFANCADDLGIIGRMIIVCQKSHWKCPYLLTNQAV